MKEVLFENVVIPSATVTLYFTVYSPVYDIPAADAPPESIVKLL